MWAVKMRVYIICFAVHITYKIKSPVYGLHNIFTQQSTGYQQFFFFWHSDDCAHIWHRKPRSICKTLPVWCTKEKTLLLNTLDDVGWNTVYLFYLVTPEANLASDISLGRRVNHHTIVMQPLSVMHQKKMRLLYASVHFTIHLIRSKSECAWFKFGKQTDKFDVGYLGQ